MPILESRAVKINIDTDQLKELAKQGGDFYKEPTAEKALRELFVGLPTLLAQAQEEAKELLIKSVGTDVPTQLVSDNIKVRVGKRAGVAKFVDGPVMGYAKKVETIKIDTEKVKEYEAEHGKLPAGIERPEPTTTFAVVDLKDEPWI